MAVIHAMATASSELLAILETVGAGLVEATDPLPAAPIMRRPERFLVLAAGADSGGVERDGEAHIDTPACQDARRGSIARLTSAQLSFSNASSKPTRAP